MGHLFTALKKAHRNPLGGTPQNLPPKLNENICYLFSIQNHYYTKLPSKQLASWREREKGDSAILMYIFGPSGISL